MLFNSIEFTIFFPIVTLIYFLLPHKFRWFHLLAASCVFYMFFIPVYLLILVFTIVIDYIAGILIEDAEGKKRKAFLLISLVANIGVLAVFKYYNFFNENLIEVSKLLHIEYALPFLTIALPVGLSFHTFQAMSYTIEVYRGNQKAERHFGIYALYVMFYPQLVAGPIERPQNLLHQFYEYHPFDTRRVTSGLQLMLWGFFKKIVIADRLAVFVDSVYDNPLLWDGTTLLIGTVFFAFQIYCDFSGYSDIAIGAAEVMGFKLMTNFNRPYHSKSISEFWSRWHISLSTWFKDYLYIPLGGNRGSRSLWYFNLFFTFLISGVWHGANWTFVIWGALNGFYLLTSIWTADLRRGFVEKIGLSKYPNLHGAIKIFITFALTCYAWIFFRANSIADAVYITRAIASSIIHPFRGIGELPASFGQIILCFAVIAVLELIHYTQRKQDVRERLSAKPFWVRWAVYYVFVLAIFLLGEFGNRKFIYFQF
jgi:alginate O-acetyltransferase complex protein AlgI